MSGRRYQLAAAVTVACLSASLALAATKKSGAYPPLDLWVQDNAFGPASSAEITAVLQSAAGEIYRHCPQTQLDGIDVYYRADHPQTDFKRTKYGRIGIGLSARDAHWAKFSFQFAHEFCHALANFADHSQPATWDPHRPNLWLEESICETASLFALRAMSRTWRTAPPYPAWKSYAPWFSDYVNQRLALPEHQLPPGQSFSVWFRAQESSLQQNADDRDRNTIIAIQLLPIFEANPAGWQAVTFLNRGSVQTTKPLVQQFTEWRSRCPGYLRPFVMKLAAVFDLNQP